MFYTKKNSDNISKIRIYYQNKIWKKQKQTSINQ